MAQILFVVDMPSPGDVVKEPETANRWYEFLENTTGIVLPLGTRQLPGGNGWLLPVENSEHLRRILANAADHHRVSHATFFLPSRLFQNLQKRFRIW